VHRAVLMLQMGRRWTAVPPWPGRQTICCALFRGHRLLAPQDCAPLPLQPAPRIYKLCQVIDASTAVNRLNMAADAKARDQAAPPRTSFTPSHAGFTPPLSCGKHVSTTAPAAKVAAAGIPGKPTRLVAIRSHARAGAETGIQTRLAPSWGCLLVPVLALRLRDPCVKSFGLQRVSK